VDNFSFYDPVKIIFGRGAIGKIGAETALYGRRALFVYGQGSIRKNGVYRAVTRSLKAAGVSVTEHGGARPNPVLSHAREGIRTARLKKCDVVVAVGGGSAIDEAKAIAAGVEYRGDVWDLFTKKSGIRASLPLIAASTLPASGSEMNSGFVLLNEETRQKFVTESDASFPKTSILDPETTAGLPREQTAYGAADALAHLLEAYITAASPDARVVDELVEGLARSVIVSTRRILKDPSDYGARSAMMWAAALAANGIGVCGYKGGIFLGHAIEHSLSAIYNLAHGAGLAIVMPACFKYQLKRTGPGRLAGFGNRVLGVKGRNEKETAELAIARLERFFSSSGAPTRLAHAGIPAGAIPELAENAGGLINLWGIDCGRAEVEKILRLAA